MDEQQTMLGGEGQDQDTSTQDEQRNSEPGQVSENTQPNNQEAMQKTDLNEEQKPTEQTEGAPESYAFNMPEGQEINESVVGAFSEAAKELNLSQESAQKLIDKVAPVMQAQQLEALSQLRQEWGTSSKTDKEFGGDKLNENMSIAKKAMDTFGTPELKTLLNETGLGDHPEVIRAFYRAGKSIKEDSFVNGKQSNGDVNIPMEKKLYPNN